jgi:hypothetical protein
VPADTEVCTEAPFVDGQVVLEVDTGDDVVEAVETNNEAIFSIPRPTPPPLCSTPTPTPG